MIKWYKRWRRRRLMEKPLPPEWLTILEQVPFFAGLAGEERERFLKYLKAFVWTRRFVGAGGLEITDEHRVIIGAVAVRLVLQLDLSYYDRLSEIVVYPYVYKHKDTTGAILGEANTWGTVVLSWPAVIHGIEDPKDGHDTALHEFAHVIDYADGAFDGTPPLHRFGDYRSWGRIMSASFLELQENAGRRRALLRDYGATDEAEFFAVASEAFFEKPDQFKARAPELYEELKNFYRTDPAAD